MDATDFTQGGRENISQPEGISGADKPQERVGFS